MHFRHICRGMVEVGLVPLGAMAVMALMVGTAAEDVIGMEVGI